MALALAAAAVLGVGAYAARGKTAQRSLSVYVDGRLYCSSPLIPGKTITIRQENGAENVIRMTENGFCMESASCKNQDCVRQGEVTTENWRDRKLKEQVICLPNRVVAALDVLPAEGSAQNTPDPDAPDI